MESERSWLRKLVRSGNTIGCGDLESEELITGPFRAEKALNSLSFPDCFVVAVNAAA